MVILLIYGYWLSLLLVIVGFVGYPYGYLWLLSMVIYGCYPWLSLVIHGYLWLSLVIHGYRWLSMVIVDFPWLLLVIRCFNQR